jgi:hypothetical protein
LINAEIERSLIIHLRELQLIRITANQDDRNQGKLVHSLRFRKQMPNFLLMPCAHAEADDEGVA